MSPADPVITDTTPQPGAGGGAPNVTSQPLGGTATDAQEFPQAPATAESTTTPPVTTPAAPAVSATPDSAPTNAFQSKVTQLQKAGFNNQEISEWSAKRGGQLLAAGFNQDEVNKYMGIKTPDMSGVQDMVKQNLEQEGESKNIMAFPQMLDKAFGMPVSSIADTGKLPDGFVMSPAVRGHLMDAYQKGTATDAGDFMQQAVPSAVETAKQHGFLYDVSNLLSSTNPPRSTAPGVDEFAQPREQLGDIGEGLEGTGLKIAGAGVKGLGAYVNDKFLSSIGSAIQNESAKHQATSIPGQMASGLGYAAFGEAGPFIAGAAEGSARTQELETKGVDKGTAVAGGLLTGLATTGAFKIPMGKFENGPVAEGASDAAKAAVGKITASNVAKAVIKSGLVGAGQYGTDEIGTQQLLKSQGYDKLADQYAPTLQGAAGNAAFMVGAHSGMEMLGHAFKSGAPTAQDFTDHSLVMFGHDGEQKGADTLRDIYKETGVVPGQVLQDATQNAEVAKSVLAGEVPKAYEHLKEPPPEAAEESEAAKPAPPKGVQYSDLDPKSDQFQFEKELAAEHGIELQPTPKEGAAQKSAPDSAFNGDTAYMLGRAFEHSDSVGMTNVGMRPEEIAGLEKDGLATDGSMSQEQYAKYEEERGDRLSGKSKGTSNRAEPTPKEAGAEVSPHTEENKSLGLEDDEIPYLRPAAPEAPTTPVSDDLKLVAHNLYGKETEAGSQVIDAIRKEVARLNPQAESRIYDALKIGGTEPVSGAFFKDVSKNDISNVVGVSLEGNTDPIGTARHEVIHSLKRMNLLSGDEWGTLEKAAEDGNWIEKHDIESRYGEAVKDRKGLLEEAVADEFIKNRQDGFKSLPEPVRALFQKIQQFLDALGDHLRQIFGKDATAQDIFSRIERGDVGERSPTRPNQEAETAFKKEKGPEHENPTDSVQHDFRVSKAGDIGEVYRGFGEGSGERSSAITTEVGKETVTGVSSAAERGKLEAEQNLKTPQEIIETMKGDPAEFSAYTAARHAITQSILGREPSMSLDLARKITEEGRQKYEPIFKELHKMRLIDQATKVPSPSERINSQSVAKKLVAVLPKAEKLEDSSTLKSALKRAANTRRWWWNDYHMFVDKLTGGDPELNKAFSVTENFRNEKSGLIGSATKLNEAIAEARGNKDVSEVKRQQFRDLRREYIKDEATGKARTFINNRGEEVKLKFSKAEARDMLHVLDQKTAYESLTSKDSKKGYTNEMLDAVKNLLDPEDIAQVQAQKQFLKEYYDKVAPVYKSMEGKELPKIEGYYPLAREGIAPPSSIDQMLNPFYGESNIEPSFTKERTDNVFDIPQRADTNVLLQHIAKVEKYVAFGEKVRDLESVLNDRDVSRLTNEHLGKDFSEYMRDHLKTFTNNGIRDYNPALRALNSIYGNFAFAKLAGKALLGAKHFSLITGFISHVPPGDFVAGLLDFAKHPQEAIKNLMTSPVMQDRYKNYDSSMENKVIAQQAQQYSTWLGRQLKNPDFLHFMMSMGQFGHQAATMIGGHAYYKYLTKEGMSHEAALRKVEDLTNETQQSGDADRMAMAQKNEVTRIANMFLSAPAGILRTEQRVISDFAKNIANDNSGSNVARETAKLAYKMVVLHAGTALLFQAFNSAFASDKDAKKEYEAKAAVGPLDGLPMVGNIINGIAAGLFHTKEAQYGVGMPGLLGGIQQTYQDANNAFTKVHKMMGDPDKDFAKFKTWLEVMGAMSKPAADVSSFAGIPDYFTTNLPQAVSDLQHGNLGEAGLATAGYPKTVSSPNTLKQEEKEKPKVRRIRKQPTTEESN